MAVLAMTLSACGVPDDRFSGAADGYPANVREAVANVDWAKAERLSITLSEFKFEPAEMTFRKGQPYALEMKNDGHVGHAIVAVEFFRAIAAKGLVYADGESSFPLLESVYLEPGESKTLLFVPLKTGDFKTVCDRPLHETFGMTGRFTIK